VPDLGLRDLDLKARPRERRRRLDAYDRDAVTAGVVLERALRARLSASAGWLRGLGKSPRTGLRKDYRLAFAPLRVAYDNTDDPLDARAGCA